MSAADDPQAWIAKAHADFLCIENNVAAAQVPWEIVAFHAQQAAEKAIKAVLVASGQAVTKTHDLIYLLNQCRAHGKHFDGLDNDCRWLTRYATQSRYPDVDSEITQSEALGAVAAARRIFAAAVELLPPHS